MFLYMQFILDFYKFFKYISGTKTISAHAVIRSNTGIVLKSNFLTMTNIFLENLSPPQEGSAKAPRCAATEIYIDWILIYRFFDFFSIFCARSYQGPRLHHCLRHRSVTPLDIIMGLQSLFVP